MIMQKCWGPSSTVEDEKEKKNTICGEIWNKTFDFLHVFSIEGGPKRTKPYPNLPKPYETITKLLQNYYETIAKLDEKDTTPYKKEATKPILRNCGYMIFNTANG